jgi:CRP-like cAMP-binding protein
LTHHPLAPLLPTPSVPLRSPTPSDWIADGGIDIGQTADENNVGASASLVRTIKIGRLLRSLRLLRLIRVSRVKAIVRSRSLSALGNLVRLIALFILCVHFLGCIYLFVSATFDDGGTSWYWTLKQNPKYHDEARMYCSGLYAATLMLCGGDVFPHTPGEQVCATGGMICGALFQASLFGKMAQLIASLNEKSSRRNQKMSTVMQHLTTLGIKDEELNDRVIEYYNYLWDVCEFDFREDFFSELSPPLRSEVNMTINGGIVRNVHLFSGFPDTAVVDIVNMLGSGLYLKGDHIILEGTPGLDMHFIRVGFCLVTVKGKLIHKMSVGDYFGEMALLLPDGIRTATVTAVINCEVVSLMASDFDGLLHRRPDLKPIVIENAKARTGDLDKRSTMGRTGSSGGGSRTLGDRLDGAIAGSILGKSGGLHVSGEHEGDGDGGGGAATAKTLQVLIDQIGHLTKSVEAISRRVHGHAT